MVIPREHNAHTSRMLFKIVIAMFFIVQILAGLVIKNFYERFTELEQENSKYDQQIDDLKTEIKVIDALMGARGAR